MTYNTCDPTIYWVGSTTERFQISNDLVISSDLTNNPNDGTGGTDLDFNWIISNFNTVNRFTFRGDANHELNISLGDAHALIVIPTDLVVSNIGESVLGSITGMVENIHYGIFTIPKGDINYTCIYFRDLTSISFPKRQFQFDVKLTD